MTREQKQKRLAELEDALEELNSLIDWELVHEYKALDTEFKRLESELKRASCI